MPSKGSKKTTIRDVARLAGVSTASVSRYLNGKKGAMTEQTAQNIQAAIQKLNYVPSFTARAMNNNASKMVAFVVSNIEDYFSVEIFRGASQVLENSGYVTVLMDTNSSLQREQELLESINQRSFDGLLLQPLTNDAQEIAKRAVRQFPIVIMDRELELSAWPQVVTNNYQASYNATRDFVAQGIDEVVVVSSQIQSASTRRQRYQGIKDALQSGQSLKTIEFNESDFSVEEVLNLLRRMIDPRKKTVLFSLKERWLLNFLPPLMREGLITSENSIVTGFADTNLIESICPFARVISQHPFTMGQRAAETLLMKLKDNDQAVPGLQIIDATLKDLSE